MPFSFHTSCRSAGTAGVRHTIARQAGAPAAAPSRLLPHQDRGLQGSGCWRAGLPRAGLARNVSPQATSGDEPPRQGMLPRAHRRLDWRRAHQHGRDGLAAVSISAARLLRARPVYVFAALGLTALRALMLLAACGQGRRCVLGVGVQSLSRVVLRVVRQQAQPRGGPARNAILCNGDLHAHRRRRGSGGPLAVLARRRHPANGQAGAS